MDYKEYKTEISNLKGANDIEGELIDFDIKKHRMSSFKLLFILPNGKCLVMPYAEGEKLDRKQDEYSHLVYITKALDLILEEFGKEKKQFIEENIKKFDVDEITRAILKLQIPFFYDTGNKDVNGNDRDGDYRYIFFEKTIRFTEKQEKTLIQLNYPLRQENYKLAIEVLAGDNKLNFKMDGLDICEPEPDASICVVFLNNDMEFDVEVFYEIIQLSPEQLR